MNSVCECVCVCTSMCVCVCHQPSLATVSGGKTSLLRPIRRVYCCLSQPFLLTAQSRAAVKVPLVGREERLMYGK